MEFPIQIELRKKSLLGEVLEPNSLENKINEGIFMVLPYQRQLIKLLDDQQNNKVIMCKNRSKR